MQVRTLKYVSHFARYVRCALHTRYNCCCANCRTFCTEAPAQCVCMVRLCPCSRLTRDKLNPSHSQSFLSLSSYDKLLCSSVNSKTTCAICTNICATLHKYMCNLHKYLCNFTQIYVQFAQIFVQLYTNICAICTNMCAICTNICAICTNMCANCTNMCANFPTVFCTLSTGHMN